MFALLENLARIAPGKTGRSSSWNTTGRNQDFWVIQPGESRVLADIKGPGCITHIWMTQRTHYLCEVQCMNPELLSDRNLNDPADHALSFLIEVVHNSQRCTQGSGQRRI